MTIRMSIARCCCVVAGCARATCQLDTFDTYGTGNSILTGSIWSDEAVNSGTAVQTASDTCLLGLVPADKVTASWGVDGGLLAPSFTTGYANRTYTEMELKSFTNYLVYTAIQFTPRGAVIGGLSVNPNLGVFVGHDGSFDIAKKAFWYDVDNVKSEVTIDSIPEGDFTQAYIQHVYRVEMYDYAQQTGSDSVSRATFQWKILEDGVVVAESHDGTTQLESRFASAPPDRETGDNWCATPTVTIVSEGYNFFSNNQVEFDNFKIVTNFDETCIP